MSGISFYLVAIGLAYIDVKKLKRTEIGIGVDGEKWIFTKKAKDACAITNTNIGCSTKSD